MAHLKSRNSNQCHFSTKFLVLHQPASARQSQDRTMKQLLISWVVLASSSSVCAQSANWEYVDGDPRSTVEIDRNSIRSEQNLRKAWSRFNWTTAQLDSSSQKSYQSEKKLVLFNCSKREYAFRQVIGYAEPNGFGSAIFSFNAPSGQLDFQQPSPDSIEKSMVQYVCTAPLKKQ